MRKIILAIISAPLAIILVAYDIIKLPLIIVVFMPLFAFFEAIEMVRDRKTFVNSVTEMKKMIFSFMFIGISMYGEMVWNREWFW